MGQLRIVKDEAKTAKDLNVNINTEKGMCIKNWTMKGIQKW